MRRRDVLTLSILIGLSFYAWRELVPPPVSADSQPVDSTLITNLTKWSGNVAKALASTTNSEGTVKGASTDGPLLTQIPESLLPVEQYYGSPSEKTLEAMLNRLSITVYPEDVVEVFPAPELGIGFTARIYRAHIVEVTDWGKKKEYRSWQKDVKAFFTEQGLELGDNDRVEPGLNELLSIDSDSLAKITITRVAVTEVKTKESIAFKTIQKEDPNLPRGQKKVDKGSAGERTKTFKVTRENGIEVKRELLKNEITKEPKDEVTVIGTKVIIGETYTGRASWYKYNSTKVATDHFKRGTQLRITNLDNGKVIFVKNDGCICADTGYVVDLHPDHFTALGGVIRDGVMKRVKIEEILN